MEHKRFTNADIGISRDLGLVPWQSVGTHSQGGGSRAGSARELGLHFENARVRGPYVLVGHSLGGLNVQVFADRHPDLVAGLLLLDPAPLPFITGQAFPELYQMLEQQAAELRQTAEAARQSASSGSGQATDAEAQAQADYLEDE